MEATFSADRLRWWPRNGVDAPLRVPGVMAPGVIAPGVMYPPGVMKPLFATELKS